MIQRIKRIPPLNQFLNNPGQNLSRQTIAGTVMHQNNRLVNMFNIPKYILSDRGCGWIPHGILCGYIPVKIYKSPALG